MRGEIVSLQENSREIDPPVRDPVPGTVHRRILREMDAEVGVRGRFVPEGFDLNNWIEIHRDNYVTQYERLNREHDRNVHEQAVDSYLWSYLREEEGPSLIAKGVFYQDQEDDRTDEELEMIGHHDRNHWLGGEVDVLAVYVDQGIAELVEIKTSSSCLERNGKGKGQLEGAVELLDQMFEVRTEAADAKSAFKDNTRFPPIYDGYVHWTENYLESEAREFIDENYLHIVPAYSEENSLERRF